MKKLANASATIPTVRGPAAISWSRKDSALVLDVNVPVNSRARIFVPVLGDAANVTISEGGSELWQNKTFKSSIAGISSAIADTGYIVVAAGSGSYHFNTQCSP